MSRAAGEATVLSCRQDYIRCTRGQEKNRWVALWHSTMILVILLQAYPLSGRPDSLMRQRGDDVPQGAAASSKTWPVFKCRRDHNAWKRERWCRFSSTTVRHPNFLVSPSVQVGGRHVRHTLPPSAHSSKGGGRKTSSRVAGTVLYWMLSFLPPRTHPAMPNTIVRKRN